jgi:hypothetical protein
MKKGRVEEIFLQGLGHLIAQEATTLCAEGMAPWVGKEVQRWKIGLQEYVEWTKKPLVEKQTLSEEWKRRVGGPPVKKGKNGKDSKL